MWDLVGNPDDRFSHNEAQLVLSQTPIKTRQDKTRFSVLYFTLLTGSTFDLALCVCLFLVSVVLFSPSVCLDDIYTEFHSQRNSLFKPE